MLKLDVFYTDPPLITTSPRNGIIKKTRGRMTTLYCKASSYDGQVLYHWEKKSVLETKWTVITPKHKNATEYTITTAISQQYRCVATNDAGSTNSEIANITLLSKIRLYMLVTTLLFIISQQVPSILKTKWYQLAEKSF